MVKTFIVISCIGLSSCLFEAKTDESNQLGALSLTLNLRPALTALLKTSSADTLFALDSLKLIFRTPGLPDTSNTYSITGRADLSNIVVTPKIFSLASLRTWTAYIIAVDTTLNPTRSDTVYYDSVSFLINPGDTTFVTKTANPAYSILRARFVSNSPASITNNVKWCRLRVDGVTQDSITVGPKILGVAYGSNSTGIMVGDSGVIFRTTNTGVNWATVTSPTTQRLNSTFFTSTNTGYAVGNGGVAFKTTTGTSWTPQTSGVSKNLNAVFFASASAGYAVGDSGAIRTTNGTTWSAATSNTTNHLYGVYSTSTSIGYAVGAAGTIIKTTNGGALWAAVSSGTTKKLNKAMFPIAATGFVVGDSGTILKTTNSGANWSALTSGTTQNLNGVYFTDANTGWVVGDGGTMLTTANGGTNWTVKVTGTKQKLDFLGFNGNKSAATAVGDLGVFLTTTNLTSWSFQLLGTKSFDLLLTYKYLKPNISHALLLDAVDTLSGALRGYQAAKSILLTPGKDTTITPNSSLTVCGYVAPACSP